MNDRQLKYIIAIAEEGNITAAAQKLYISQPSLSFLLARVEESLGTKLFDRSISPMKLTYAGEHYVEAAKKMVMIHKDLMDQIDDIVGKRKSRLVIGCSERLSSFLFPTVLPTYIKQNPGIQIKLFEERVPILEDLLASGELEVVFSTSVIQNRALERIPIFKEELLLLTPKDYTPPNASTSNAYRFPLIDFSDVIDQPFVLFKKKHRLRRLADMFFEDLEAEPNIILETDNWETCFYMTLEGLACTLLPYSPLTKKILQDNADKINRFSFQCEYTRELAVYYRKNTYHDNTISDFIKMAQNTLKNI